ncbi:MAG: serine hydroxymethyltransferase [Candidatus Aenigmatarchaeota archaeon]
MRYLRETDPQIEAAVRSEANRARNGLELIPSENFTSLAVMQTMGSVFTNKYSEGYPGKRYYGGNEFVDVAESLAIERAKKLFGAEHVNVQPLSGSPANQAVFFALLNLGDTFMGMDLSCGGHLTHGSPVNFSGKNYKCIPYGVDRETELIDFDEVRKIALQCRPKLLLSGLTAYPRKLDFKAFQEIAQEVGAYHFADIAHIAGLVAAGLHENPVEVCDVVTTTTHKTLRGPRGAIIMCKNDDRLHGKYHPDSKKNLSQLIDSAVFPGLQGGPHDHVNAAKAVAFLEALQPEFKVYARQILKNAKALADELMAQGFRLVTGGTENHLMVADVWQKGVSGKEAQNLLDTVGIYLNKNTIPFDTRSPFDPSGIRLGTPALTTRGMKEGEMKEVGSLIARALLKRDDQVQLSKVRAGVAELCSHFPLYPELPDGYFKK